MGNCSSSGLNTILPFQFSVIVGKASAEIADRQAHDAT